MTSKLSAVSILIIINILVFGLQQIANQTLILNFALWPIDVNPILLKIGRISSFHFHQLFTYAFLHGGWLHLILNMYALWLFGKRMEWHWGTKKFVYYYIVCVFGAAFIQIIVTHITKGQYPTVGASGGVFGLLLAFGMSFPKEKLMLLIPPMPIQARWFVMIYGAIELYAGVTGTAAGIEHFAHLGGMLFGYFMIVYWRKNKQIR